MLTIQSATDRDYGSRSTIGLALAGGGPLGGIYEIGALRALEEGLEGLDFNQLDVYVGVSSGAFFAASLANRLTLMEMARIFVDSEAVGQLLAPEVFLKPALFEYFQRATSAPERLLEALGRFVRNPQDLRLWESFTGLSQALPTGLFDNEVIHEFLSQIYSLHGCSNDFRELEHPLYIVAVELDTGEAVKFGSTGHDGVPISKAVQASAALPGLYPPVLIDGRYYVDGALRKTLHASAALDAGANLLFCINPLVPFDAKLAARTQQAKPQQLIEGGLPVILSQTFRTLIYSRMEVGMAAYRSHYPRADVVLFEPDRDDPEMFFTSVFSHASRHQVCEHAYQATRRDLLARRRELEPLLDRHGIALRLDLLEDRERHFSTALSLEPAAEPLTGRLSQALDRLQSWLEGSR